MGPVLRHILLVFVTLPNDYYVAMKSFLAWWLSSVMVTLKYLFFRLELGLLSRFMCAVTSSHSLLCTSVRLIWLSPFGALVFQWRIFLFYFFPFFKHTHTNKNAHSKNSAVFRLMEMQRTNQSLMQRHQQSEAPAAAASTAAGDLGPGMRAPPETRWFIRLPRRSLDRTLAI